MFGNHFLMPKITIAPKLLSHYVFSFNGNSFGSETLSTEVLCAIEIKLQLLFFYNSKNVLKVNVSANMTLSLLT